MNESDWILGMFHKASFECSVLYEPSQSKSVLPCYAMQWYNRQTAGNVSCPAQANDQPGVVCDATTIHISLSLYPTLHTITYSWSLVYSCLQAYLNGQPPHPGRLALTSEKDATLGRQVTPSLPLKKMALQIHVQIKGTGRGVLAMLVLSTIQGLVAIARYQYNAWVSWYFPMAWLSERKMLLVKMTQVDWLPHS